MMMMMMMMMTTTMTMTTTTVMTTMVMMTTVTTMLMTIIIIVVMSIVATVIINTIVLPFSAVTMMVTVQACMRNNNGDREADLDPHVMEAGGEGLEHQPLPAHTIAAHLLCPADGSLHACHSLGIDLVQDGVHLLQLHSR